MEFPDMNAKDLIALIPLRKIARWVLRTIADSIPRRKP